MTGQTPSFKPGKTFGDKAAETLAVAIVGIALTQSGKLVKRMADSRKAPKSRYVTIYHDIDKVRNIGEKALTLGDKGPADERQRMVAQSAVLCDTLHEQLAALRLSPATQKTSMLDTAARTAIKDADSLTVALNRWALNSSDVTQTHTLQQAVVAIDASEDALVSFLGKTPRKRPWQRGKEHSSDDNSI
jgi:hypothetical protein